MVPQKLRILAFIYFHWEGSSNHPRHVKLFLNSPDQTVLVRFFLSKIEIDEKKMQIVLVSLNVVEFIVEKMQTQNFAILYNFSDIFHHIQAKQFQDLTTLRWQSFIQCKIYFAIENTSRVFENLDFTFFSMLKIWIFKYYLSMCRIVVQLF